MQLGWKVKSWFFDRAIIGRLVNKANREALAKAGALVRTFARRSMRYVTASREQRRLVALGRRKRLSGDPGPSAPGTPPHAIRPRPFIRQFLFYAYDPSTASVVIGPIRLSSKTNVPALHETGGRAIVRNPRRIQRRLGRGGEVRIGGRPSRRTTAVLNRQGATVMVTYARLRTSTQVARANQLNEALYGPMYHMAEYPPRPFMGPALAAARPSLPQFWRASVNAA